MSWIKDLRKKTGISQIDLGIPRSTLAMAESEDRDLPATPLLKLANLQIAMSKPETVAGAAAMYPPLSKQEQDALQKKLLQHAGYLRLKALLLERKIAVYDKKVKQDAGMQVLLAAASNLHAASPAVEKEQRWLESMQYTARNTAAPKNKWEQQLLLLQHESLLAEAASAERKAAELLQ